MLTFFSCTSGKGPEGDSLLTEVSNVLPGRTIVGFCVYVVVGRNFANTKRAIVISCGSHPREKAAYLSG
jgi:hypothetical protein